MHLEADDGLPAHQRTSASAATTRSSAAAAASMRSSSKNGAMSCAPIGRPFAPTDRQAQRREAGQADGADEDVGQVHGHGILGLLPARNAGVGVVGVSSRSTPPAKARRKSSAMRARGPLRLSIVGVVVSGAQHVRADQDPALHLGPESLAPGGLVERADVAIRARPSSARTARRRSARDWRPPRPAPRCSRSAPRRRSWGARRRTSSAPSSRAAALVRSMRGRDAGVRDRPGSTRAGGRCAGRRGRGAASAARIGGRSSVVLSRGSWPLIAASTFDASSTVRPNTEMQSSDDPNATRPNRLTRP